MAVDTNNDKTRFTLETAPRKQKEGKTDLPPELKAINRNLHDQILASLWGQDEASLRSEDGEKGDKATPKGREILEQTRSEGPSEEVAEKLHGLVETMLSHLHTKEATVSRGADAYRNNGIDCVDKIERNYGKERRTLADACKKDGDRFAQRVREARGALEDQAKAREEAMQRLEETAAKRRQLYQQTTTSLRALHGRLLKNKLAED
ncbi:hypothetical protein FDECE_7248 [Fusarium decemcellulare]|nr:hypothetical protein FDECE_7248 [Fusarium decemcellulare]